MNDDLISVFLKVKYALLLYVNHPFHSGLRFLLGISLSSRFKVHSQSVFCIGKMNSNTDIQRDAIQVCNGRKEGEPCNILLKIHRECFFPEPQFFSTMGIAKNQILLCIEGRLRGCSL